MNLRSSASLCFIVTTFGLCLFMYGVLIVLASIGALNQFKVVDIGVPMLGTASPTARKTELGATLMCAGVAFVGFARWVLSWNLRDWPSLRG